MLDQFTETDRPSAPVFRRLLEGLAAGLLATVPMSIAMLAMYRLLPRHERYPLPPKLITEEITEKAKTRQNLEEPEVDALTVVAHFGYGALMGTVFSLLAWKLPFSKVLGGLLYAMLVWTGSYLGWLPAFHILTPATQHPPRRNILMIISHMVWGVSSGWLLQRFEELRSEWKENRRMEWLEKKAPLRWP